MSSAIWLTSPETFCGSIYSTCSQLRALILDWEVSEVVLEEQTGEKGELYLHFMSELNPL